jgi:hypothetical protein
MDNKIQSEKEWRMTLTDERRKTAPTRITSIDGLGDKGQFYITAETPSGSKIKVVVTSSFLDKKLKKLRDTKLFRIGAPIFWKHTEGVLAKKRVYKSDPRYGNETYMDLEAVFTEDEESEWISLGLF